MKTMNAMKQNHQETVTLDKGSIGEIWELILSSLGISVSDYKEALKRVAEVTESEGEYKDKVSEINNVLTEVFVRTYAATDRSSIVQNKLDGRIRYRTIEDNGSLSDKYFNGHPWQEFKDTACKGAVGFGSLLLRGLRAVGTAFAFVWDCITLAVELAFCVIRFISNCGAAAYNAVAGLFSSDDEEEDVTLQEDAEDDEDDEDDYSDVVEGDFPADEETPPPTKEDILKVLVSKVAANKKARERKKENEKKPPKTKPTKPTSKKRKSR